MTVVLPGLKATTCVVSNLVSHPITNGHFELLPSDRHCGGVGPYGSCVGKRYVPLNGPLYQDRRPILSSQASRWLVGFARGDQGARKNHRGEPSHSDDGNRCSHESLPEAA